MSLSINNNLTALQALGTQQGVTANNIANSETAGFKKSRTILEEGATGAVIAKTQPVNTPGTPMNLSDGSVEESSNVDLAQEVTGMIPTKNAYAANLAALKTTAEMEENVLDLIG